MSKKTNNFPPSFFRGIPNNSEQFIDTLGNPTGNIFRPHSKQVPIDSYYNMSINWEDDDTVLAFTLDQRNSQDEIKFKGGVAKIEKSEIDKINFEPPFLNSISYNRRPIRRNCFKSVKKNLYHGNLLLHEARFVDKNGRRAFLSRLKRTIIKVYPPKI